MSSKPDGGRRPSGSGKDDAPNDGETLEEGRTSGADRPWLLHRAEVEWRAAMHNAAAEYFDRLMNSYATHQGALAELVRDAYGKELAALPAERDASDGPAAAAEETFDRWRAAVDEGQ